MVGHCAMESRAIDPRFVNPSIVLHCLSSFSRIFHWFLSILNANMLPIKC